MSENFKMVIVGTGRVLSLQ